MLYQLLIVILVITQGEILYLENFIDDSFVDSEGWAVKYASQSIGNCSITKLFGGYGVFGKNTIITNLINLPAHYAIKITFEFWKMDSWDNEYFYMYFDQNLIFSKQYGTSDTNQNLCGSQTAKIYHEEVSQISVSQNHNFKTLFILMTTNLQGIADEWWGIRHFRLYIYPCPSGCQSCTQEDSSIDCSIWVIQYQSLLTVDPSQFQMEGWMIFEGESSKSICSSIPMVGGLLISGKNSKIIKSINLPVHCQIKIQFRFIFIDRWDSAYAQLYVDNELIWNYNHSSVTNKLNLCGNNFGENILNEKIILPHKQQLLQLQFTTTLKNSLSQSAFGIRDIEIFIQCPYGFPLDLDCGGICGNGVIDKTEQCDDGNIFPFDGCFNCQYSCVEGCSNCIEGICFECQENYIYQDFQCAPISIDILINDLDEQQECVYGYKLINKQCQTVCGDGIIAGSEVCEIEEQECHNCQFICFKNCDFCIEGGCHQCIFGYSLNLKEQYCQPICGNGIVTDDEECDDQNQLNGDGCSSQCKIEQNYVCRNLQYSFTECSYEKQPSFKLSLINSYHQYQYVSIYFDQMVKKKSSNLFSTTIQMRLIGPSETSYSLHLIPIQEPFELVSAAEYQIEILINTTLEQPPILEVILGEQLFNYNDASLLNQHKQIQLNIPSYINDQLKQNALQLSSVAKYTIISMGGSAVIILILFGSLLVQEMLEILQQQSYLKFINVVFPLNLFIYFESSNLVSIQPVLDKIKFNNILTQFMNDQYLESQGKLLFYEVNANILSNITTQVFIIIIIIITYYSAYVIIIFIRRLNNQQFFQFGTHFAKFIMIILKSLQNFKRNFQREAFQDFLNTNSWDLLFMSLLQVSSQSPSIACYFLAYLIFYVNLFLSSKILFRTSFPIMRSQKQLWISKSNQIKLFKKALFISVLVMFQQNQKLQIMLLSLVCQFYLIYLFIMKPFKSITGYVNTMTLEISSFIFCFSSALYWNDFQYKLNYETQIQFAWFQIGILLLCLFINLISQLCMICLELKKIVVKWIQKSHPQQQNQIQMKGSPFTIP
ncbi:unnamed protein product [Paramecium octaurelia]|uniref:Uncharacterized protein n=1 Tax=Paramecium octaurelia TaxID=43137 RepID=A0A8S1W0T0_PAROT|nr:unnamed protein product [Paramecium octaurelia]